MYLRIGNKNGNIVELLFLIIPFFRPDFVTEMYGDSLLNTIFAIWRILSFVYIFVKTIKYEQIKFDIIFGVILLYELFMAISCLLNHVSLVGRIINFGNFLGIYLIYKYYADRNPLELVRTNFNLFSIMILINFILTLIFPNGLNNALNDSARINFLGKDNTVTLFFLTAIIFCVLYSNLYPKNIKPIITFIIIILTQIYYFSGSGIIAIALLTFYILVLWKNSIVNKMLNPNFVILFFLILEYAIVFLGKIDFISFIFEWLQKSSTFSDRRYYWNTAISQFLSSPLLGQGNGIVNLWDNSYYSHNAILDVMLKGGIIGVICWLILLLVITNWMKLKDNVRIKGFISCTFLIFLLIGLVEGLEDRIVFNAFLVIISIIDILAKKNLLHDKLINVGIKIVIRK